METTILYLGIDWGLYNIGIMEKKMETHIL